MADSDPIAISQKVSDELFEGFSEYSPSAGYEDGRYEVVVNDPDGVRVPKRKLRRICRLTAGVVPKAERREVLINDVNSPNEYEECDRLLPR